MGHYRDLMDRELRIRGYAPHTCRAYLGCVANFFRHTERPPSQVTLDDVNQYQLYMTRERGVTWENCDKK